MLRRLLLILGLFCATASIAAVSTTPVFVQTPILTSIEIVDAVAQCTGSGQPWSCCTGAGAGATCNAAAESTDALPVWVTLYTGSSTAPGSKIISISLTTSDATAHVVTCAANNNGVRTVLFALTTGTTKPGFAAGVLALNLLTTAIWPSVPIDNDGNPFIFLTTNTDKIDCRYTVALSSGTALDFSIVASNF